MKKFTVFCLGMFLFNNVFAGCDWATTTPPDDSKYTYLVAKSYSETSASDAAQKAEQDIDSQIGRIFGTKMDVVSEFYSDESTASGTTRSYERTIGVITLKGLERQKGDVEKNSHGWTGCVQYRYSKSEIAKEQKRLQEMPKKDSNKRLVFTEVVGDKTCNGSPVEIVTEPTGTYVTIDNGKYQGYAPIKFGNVCNGKHILDISHDNYEPISETLIVPASGRISKTLKRATKTITIKTSIGNSEIEVNGVDKGKEPVTLKIPLGIEQTITAVNNEAVKITRTRMFSKESDATYIIPMEKLPGKIDFSAFKKRNPGVSIYVDGSLLKEDITKEISAMTHTITFEKNGSKKAYTLDIPGGQTTYYPSQEIAFEQTNYSNNSTKSYNQNWTNNSYFKLNTHFGADVGIGLGDNFGFNVGIMYEISWAFLYSNFGLELNYITSYDDYEYDDNYDSLDYEYFEWAYGELGLNLSKKFAIFGIATYGSVMLDSYDYEFDSIKMNRYGFGARYLFDDHWGMKISYLTGKANTPKPDTYYDPYSYYSSYSYNQTNKSISITTYNIDVFLRF